MAAQLAQMGMGLTDTVMAGRLSAQDLAGVALGGSVFWPLNLLLMGVLQAVTPTVSQLNGAGRDEEVGEVIRQGLYMAMVCALLLVAAITHAGPYYELMEVDPAATAISIPYLEAIAWGAPALLGYFVLRYMAEGLGYTRPAMFIAVSALAMKIPLNMVFMYGWFGLPAMGGVGCGVATAIVMWFQLFAITFVVTRHRFDSTGWHSRITPPSWREIRPLVAVGIPIGATLFFEVGFFTFITVLLGRFGAETVASHTIAMNLGGITFMIPLALGMAATIRVGFHVGSRRPDRARLVAAMAIGASVGCAVIGATIVILARHTFASLYSTDPVVIELAASLMLFVAVYQLFDNSQATAIGALRGYKDTQVPMYTTLVGYWFVGLPIAMALGFGWISEPMGVYGFWIGLACGLAFVAISICSRLWWRSRQAFQS
jgi:MATE family multidrug resistance protein